MELSKKFQVGGKGVKVIKYVLMITALVVMMAMTMSFTDSCFYELGNNCQDTQTTEMTLP
jgi:multisubunit Na+/H+ antiporter MnhC subunit